MQQAMPRAFSRDPLLWLCPIGLWLAGLLELWSLSRGLNYPVSLLIRQSVIGLLGLLTALFLARLRWPTVLRLLPWGVGLSAVSLLAVLAIGTNINGAERWLSLGPLGSFQPSEPAKLSAMVATAYLMTRSKTASQGLAKTLAMVGLFALLIFFQPDLGTALVLAGVSVGLAYLAGAPWKPLAALLGSAVAVLPWCLDEYQWQRIHTFLTPESDPSGAGWNLEQAKIAIGSGGVWGKGAFHGLQGPLDFLPEAHSDFIFAVLSEEYGFLACLWVVCLTTTLVSRLFYHGRKLSHPMRALVLVGLGLHFSLHAALNLGMTIGIAPVTGSPLPFVSFGGTALFCNFAAIGLAEAILRAQRFSHDA